MQTASYYSSIYNAVEDLADRGPNYHGEFPNQECIPAATAQTMIIEHNQAFTWLSLQVISRSILTSTASQNQGQVQAQLQFCSLNLVLCCKVNNARLLCSIPFSMYMCKFNYFPAARIRNVVEKVSHSQSCLLELELWPKIWQTQNRRGYWIWQQVAKHCSVLTSHRAPADGSVRMWPIQK